MRCGTQSGRPKRQRDRYARCERRSLRCRSRFGQMALLNAMPLAAGDLIYFSDFVDTQMRRTPAWQPEQVFTPWTSPAFASRRPPFGPVSDLGIQIILRRCRGMILKSSFTEFREAI